MKKLKNLFIPALCALVYFALFFNGIGLCDDESDECGSLIGVTQEVKVTFVNNSKEDTHLYYAKKGDEHLANAGNKVKPGGSRTQTVHLQLYAGIHTVELNVVAFRNGEIIGKTFYKLAKDVSEFTVVYPW